MTESTRPFMVLYVVWHPLYAEGASIAELLRHHFRRKHYENISSGMGLSVIFRSDSTPGAATPMPIDMDEAETTAVVVLAEATLAGDFAWIGFVRELVEHAEARGLGSQIFPVMLERAGLDIRIDVQALRWDRWEGPEANRRRGSTPINRTFLKSPIMGERNVMTKRRKFSAEFKREAVQLANHPGVTKTQIARELGINSNLLGRWCRQHSISKAAGCLSARAMPETMRWHG